MCVEIRFVTHKNELPEGILKLIQRSQLQVRVLEKKQVANPADNEIPLVYVKRGIQHPFARIERADHKAHGIGTKPWCPNPAFCVGVRDLEGTRNSDPPLIRARDERFKLAANRVPEWFSAHKSVA